MKNKVFKKKKSLGNKMPFEHVLDFTPVIEQWKDKLKTGTEGQKAQAKEVLDLVEKTPELKEFIYDFEVVEKYKDEIEVLLSDLFPKNLQLNEIKAAVFPFSPQPFNQTQRMLNIWADAEEDFELSINEEDVPLMFLFGCLRVLGEFYGKSLAIHRPWIISIPNKKTKLTHHYRILFNADFITLEAKGEIPKITDEQIDQLKNDHINFERWKKIINPDNYRFRGIGIMSLVDITEQHSLSVLKGILLSGDSEVGIKSLDDIEFHVRNVFKLPELTMGFTRYDKKYNRFLSSEKGDIKSFIVGEDQIMEGNEYIKKVRSTFKKKPIPMVFEDLSEAAAHCKVSKKIKDQGMGSLILAPIFLEKELAGIIEFASPNAGDLNILSTVKMKDLLPMLSDAAVRSLKEFDSAVESMIKDKFTSMHPSVEWRFEEAALNLIKRQLAGEETEDIEPIVFSNVYPLFGQADIRNSSTRRNDAIQADLVKQLNLAKAVLENASENVKAIALEEVLFRTDKYISDIGSGLQAGDEVSVQEFFRYEVEPLIEHLKNTEDVDEELIDRYFGNLDKSTHMVYEHRQLYEKSVSIINDCVGNVLEKRQIAVQEVYPHYFEKYKTDGVEYNMYIGGSMNPSKEFNPLYLKNLRLWQLVTMCEVVQAADKKKKDMPIALEIASLILAQSTPLSIRFRMDEKQFDVDGTYNVRYEIVKKRIDKAYIKGTGERLTQPGKIAIVYSQQKEIDEYENYFKFLKAKNLIHDEIEYCDLDDLPGANGLKAVRLEVLMQESKSRKEESIDAILEQIGTEV